MHMVLNILLPEEARHLLAGGTYASYEGGLCSIGLASELT